MIPFYYGGAVVRLSTVQDVALLAPKLRRADVDEIWASGHTTPKEALVKGITLSRPCYTLEYKGEVVAMFGVVPDQVVPNVGSVWLLGSDRINEIKKTFYAISRFFIPMLLERRQILYNFIDARNTQSLRWLKRCGATISDPVPYGIDGRRFYPFTLVKG